MFTLHTMNVSFEAINVYHIGMWLGNTFLPHRQFLPWRQVGWQVESNNVEHLRQHWLVHMPILFCYNMMVHFRHDKLLIYSDFQKILQKYVMEWRMISVDLAWNGRGLKSQPFRKTFFLPGQTSKWHFPKLRSISIDWSSLNDRYQGELMCEGTTTSK